ncbi:MAG: HipA domain-containing protein [Sulfurimonas sp.]|nr:HipA domain-containing protein [Sulfurimonas sp.]
MNYLLKNGDAHLKNFGILYDKELKNNYFAPAYDIVNTIVYFNKDRPALSMFGKKALVWEKRACKVWYRVLLPFTKRSDKALCCLSKCT